jgi:chromosome segregation ATPase
MSKTTKWKTALDRLKKEQQDLAERIPVLREELLATEFVDKRDGKKEALIRGELAAATSRQAELRELIVIAAREVKQEEQADIEQELQALTHQAEKLRPEHEKARGNLGKAMQGVEAALGEILELDKRQQAIADQHLAARRAVPDLNPQLIPDLPKPRFSSLGARRVLDRWATWQFQRAEKAARSK